MNAGSNSGLGARGARCRTALPLPRFVEPTEANARKLRDALGDFGFGEIAPSIEARG
jgi:hypothetical protein